MARTQVGHCSDQSGVLHLSVIYFVGPTEKQTASDWIPDAGIRPLQVMPFVKSLVVLYDAANIISL